MNFKDLQYSIGRLTTDVRSHMARNNPLQKQDTKALSMWIFNERNNLATMRTLAYQQSETIKVFQQWTKEELLNDKDDNGRDIEDIGDKLVKLLEKQTEIEQQYAAKYQQYRHAIKSIRDREDRLSDIREKKRTLSSRITNLTKTSPKSPKLRELEKELGSLDRDTHDTELEMGDFKRFALKEAFYLRFNAMNEYAEKTAMIAGFGKYIVDLLDIAPSESKRRTYDKGIEAAMIFADAINAVEAWQPQEGDERPTIAANTSKHQGTDATRVDDEDTLDADTTGKGKKPLTTTAPSQQGETDDNTPTPTSTTPPRLPPRSPVPSHHEPPTTPPGPTASDHKSVQRQESLDQLDLYDAPPPAYQPSPVNHHEQPHQHDQPTPASHQKPEQPTRVTLHDQPVPAKEEEPLAPVTLQDQPVPVKQEEQPIPVTLQDQPAPVKQEEPPTPVTLPDQPAPVKEKEPLTPVTLQDQPVPVKQEEQPIPVTLQDQPAPVKQEEPPTPATLPDQPAPVKQGEQQQQQSEESSNSPRNSIEPVAASVPQEPKQSIPDIQEPAPVSPSLPPAPSVAHARPITHEDKEEIDDGGFESPYQSHNTIQNSTPSTPQYQQSPLPMHQPQYQPSPAVSYHQPHSNSTMSWTVPYGGVEPQYHHGQYQQLYEQLTERQQQRPVQRPYSEFQQQYVRPDIGGFRVPTPTTSAPLSAEDEKRRLAERYALEETQARKASIQTLQQERKPDPKKSVILPEGEHHGYKPSPRK